MKANNVVCLFSLVFFGFVSASAQQNSNGFSMGVIGGLNLSGLRSSLASTETSPLLRLNFGGLGKYNLQKNLDAHVGFLYSGLGGGSKQEFNDFFTGERITIESKITTASLQVPFDIGYTFFEEESMRVSALLGGFALFTFSSKQTFEDDFFEDVNIGPSVDLGLSLGVNVELTEDISIRTTYNYGLLPQFTLSSNGFAVEQSKLSNRFLQFNVVYYLYRL